MNTLVIGTAEREDRRSTTVDREALDRLRVAVWDVDLVRGHDSVPRVQRAHEELLEAARAVLDGQR